MSSYRSSHDSLEHAARYNDAFTDPTQAKALYWTIEQQIIRNIVADRTPFPERALDFACGTGRVLGLLSDELRIPDVAGVDSSDAMMQKAAENAPSASLIVGDLTRDPDLLTGTFDLITAFRFFLNAEPELRSQALDWFATHTDHGATLLVNLHRNARSLPGLTARARRSLTHSHRPRTMTIPELRAALKSHGFTITALHGYGYLPHGTHGGGTFHARPLVTRVERSLSAIPPIAPVAGHVILQATRTTY